MNAGSAYPSHTSKLSAGVFFAHDATNRTSVSSGNQQIPRCQFMLPPKLFMGNLGLVRGGDFEFPHVPQSRSVIFENRKFRSLRTSGAYSPITTTSPSAPDYSTD